jgi:hypothetical protein
MSAASPAPSPAELDQVAKQYLDLKDKVMTAKLAYAELQQEMELKGESLKDTVAKFGSAHAEKSKLMHGLAYEVVVTFGQTVSIDAVAVDRFRHELVMNKKTRLLKKLFEQTVRWTLNPQASEIVRGEKLSDKLRSLFAKCQVMKERTPSLSVREKAA